MKTNKAISKITSLLLAFALVLGFAPTLQVSAATYDVTVPLSTGMVNGTGYTVEGSVITVTAPAGKTVLITGDGTNNGNGYSIVISNATDITIADGTTIKAVQMAPVLSVPPGATITGLGDGITITGQRDGIVAKGALTLSGTMGDITSGGYMDNAIYTIGSLTINGTVGDITGTSGMGIHSSGAVNISGKTGKIAGSGQDISAASYSVLDYTTTGNLDPANCAPAGGHTVAFNYSGVTMTGVDAPVRAHTSPSGKIPAFTVPTVNGQTVLGWYTDTALTTPWDFATDTVDGTVTALYAKCSIVQPTVPQSFTATAGDAKVDLAWAAPASNGGSPITKYQYSASTGADNWLDIPSSDATTTSYLVSGLTNGTPYTFKVRAVNAIGDSPEATATATPAATIAPTITTATLPNGQVNAVYNQTLAATGTAPIARVASPNSRN